MKSYKQVKTRGTWGKVGGNRIACQKAWQAMAWQAQSKRYAMTA